MFVFSLQVLTQVLEEIKEHVPEFSDRLVEVALSDVGQKGERQWDVLAFWSKQEKNERKRWRKQGAFRIYVGQSSGTSW